MKHIAQTVLLFAIFLTAGCTTAAQEKPSFRFIVEPYLQQVTDSSFHVLWETSESAKGAVLWGIAEFNVLAPKLTEKVSENDYVPFHQLAINGLKTGEHYFYKVISVRKSGDTLSGPVTPIFTPDYRKMPVSFSVVSDTQNNPVVWGRLADLIFREKPSFVIHCGDLVQFGPNREDWVDEFFKPASRLFRFCPFYASIGNHEKKHENYFKYVDFPGNEWFYTVKKGNTLFVFVDTNRDILPGSGQYKNLQKILATSQETWKIVVHHQPVYTSSENSYGNTWFQRQFHGDPNEMHLKTLYETYGVDMVLNGHIHMYERTWPIAGDTVDFRNGVVYMTLGGGGGRLDLPGANRTWYAAKTRDTYHFLNVSIAGDKLFASAIDTSGVVFDSWTTEKETGYKRLNAPLITETKQYFPDSAVVTIENLNGHGTLYYGVNNGGMIESGKNAVVLPISETTSVSAYIADGNQQSRMARKTFTRLPAFPAIKKAGKGVVADYFEGNWIALPDFDKLKPLKTYQLDSVSLDNIRPRAEDHFAVRFTGFFSAPETNVYRFLLESFDGSKLFIDGKEIISNDGIHYEISKENFIALEKGVHAFDIRYFDFVRRETLNIGIGTQPENMKNFNNLIFRK